VAHQHVIQDWGRWTQRLGFYYRNQRLICTLQKLGQPIFGVGKKFNNRTQTSLEREGIQGNWLLGGEKPALFL
jgi:hypothetical protein